MTERDRIYLQILEFGLVSIRSASYGGDVEYCTIESDHLHNLPSLIGETNEGRHSYYFDVERTSYLKAVAQTSHAQNSNRYKKLWAQLEKIGPQN